MWKYQIIDGNGLHFTDEIEYDSLEQAKIVVLNNWNSIYNPEAANVFNKIDKNHMDVWGFNLEGHRGEWHHRGIWIKSTYQLCLFPHICSVLLGITIGSDIWIRTHSPGYSLLYTILTIAVVAIPCFIFTRGTQNED